MTNANNSDAGHGTFPFPLSEAPGNSPYLVWVRNRASYLTVGGVGNLFSSLAGFAWGVGKNLLCLLPVLLLVGLAIASLHFVLLDNWLLSVGIIAVAFATVAAYLDWVKDRVSAPLGRETSDVERRMQAARIGGWLALGILVGLFVVAIPLAVELLRELLRGGLWSGNGIVGSIGGAIALITGLQKFLPQREGRFERVASVILAMAAALALTLALIAVCDFARYGNPLAVVCKYVSESKFYECLFYAITLAASLLFISFCLCLRHRGIGPWDLVFGFAISVFPLACLLGIALQENKRFSDHFEGLNSIGNLTRPLYLLAAKPVDPTQISQEYAVLLASLESQGRGLTSYFALQPPSPENSKFTHSGWQTQYYGMAQRFAVDGHELVETNDLALSNFRASLCRVDRRALLQMAQRRLNLESGAAGGDRSAADAGLAEQMQQRCQRTVAFLTAMRLLADNAQGMNNFVSGTLNVALSDESIDQLVELLQNEYPSAVEEDQFALITGRADELPTGEYARRYTITTPASIPVLREAGVTDALRMELRRAVLRHRFANAAPAVANAVPEGLRLPASFATLIQSEMERASDGSWLSEQSLQVLAAIAAPPSGDANHGRMAVYAREAIFARAIDPSHLDQAAALQYLGKLTQPEIPADASEDERMQAYQTRPAEAFTPDELIQIAVARFAMSPTHLEAIAAADRAVMKTAAGRFGDLTELQDIREEVSEQSFPIKARWILWIAGVIGTFCFVVININSTSIHGFYRDRLSSTFLLRKRGATVAPEDSIGISKVCEEGSVGPYPIINTAVNMQSSSDLSLRDVQSDCFVFTKWFCGGERTGYVSTSMLERARPEIRLNTAMAISAAAASPNMGRMTNGFMTMLLTLLNIRLGYWVPNPRAMVSRTIPFHRVYRREVYRQIGQRWNAVYQGEERSERGDPSYAPIASNGLFGLAFSGGGIRSAAFNLGVAQALDEAGMFRHFDYLSSVSGGGYTASAIATLMRFAVASKDANLKVPGAFGRHDLNARHAKPFRSFVKRQQQVWRLPHLNLGREMVSCLHEGQRWVNLSDGGHIENLGAIELLRRHCKYIVIGDAEADPEHKFNGVGSLIEFASLELNARIDLSLTDLRLDPTHPAGKERLSCSHWAMGTVEYLDEAKPDARTGYILYLKSSLSGDEPEAVRCYAAAEQDFPHQPTSDQFFDIQQFEAYRQLGVHVTRSALQGMLSAVRQVQHQDLRLPLFEELPQAFTKYGDASLGFEKTYELQLRIHRSQVDQHQASSEPNA